MPYGLYISAEGANAQSRRLEVISNNLANVDTVGFKRQAATFRARYAEVIEQGMLSPGSGAIEDVGGGILLQETKTDFSPGPLKHTGNRSHVGIPGEGFFVVQKGDETFLTRAGNFMVNNGRLVTQQGYDVLSDNGSPINIDPSDPSWQITDTGIVEQAAGRQRLALVMPESLGDLVTLGENLFKSFSDPQPLPAADRRVAPEFIEASAVRPTSEMTEMIKTARALEANVNIMKFQDQMLGNLVNRVLKV